MYERNDVLTFICISSIWICVLTTGILLVLYNESTICEDCKPGYNVTMINDVKTCITITQDIINSYKQCNVYRKEPGYGFGWFLVALCVLLIGGPIIVVVDID